MVNEVLIPGLAPPHTYLGGAVWGDQFQIGNTGVNRGMYVIGERFAASDYSAATTEIL